MTARSDPVVLSDLSLGEVLGRLAARTPAPGGGSAAALAACLSAALVEMVAAFADARGIVARAGELRASLLDLAARDELSYAPVLGALALPVDDAERPAALAAALSAAAAVPLEVAERAAELAALARDAAPAGRQVAGDAAAAAVLAEAACRAAALLADMNLTGTVDPRREEGERLVRAAGAAREDTLHKATER